MNYWKKRATQQLLKTEKKSEKVIDELVNLYDRSFSDIEQRIRYIFETYTNDGQMTKLEALKYLNEMETAKYYDEIRKKIPKAESEEERQQLLNIYNSRAYGYRISRLMALENEMYMAIIRCKGIEEKLTRRHYEEIIIDRYQELIKDNVFTATTKYELEQMLDEKWLGSNFSDRIWKDQKKLTEELNKVLKVGLFTGKSNASIAEEIKERMNVSLFNATRLVRTESNYYHNQIDLRAYKDMGIEKYRYLAVLDNRTSDICQELDGQVFEVSKAEVGVNFPPMHPFCRSTTIRADVEIKERIARDYKTNKNYYTKTKTYKEYETEQEEKHPITRASVSSEKTVETLKSNTRSGIINMSNKDEIINYFKEKYNIELVDLDKLMVDDIKPALCGVDDFVKDFPGAGKFIKRIEYHPGLNGRYADMGSDGIMRIRKDGFSDYGTGIHESAHALDFSKSFKFDKEKYSERIIYEILKEKGIRKNGREYERLLRPHSIPFKYSKKEYNIELFAFSLQDYYSKKEYGGIGESIFKKIKGEN